MIWKMIKTLFRKKKRVRKSKQNNVDWKSVKDILCVANKLKDISILNGLPYNVYYVGGSLVVEYGKYFVTLHLTGTGTFELDDEIQQDPEMVLLTRFTYLNFKGNTKTFKDLGKIYHFDENEVREMIKGIVN